MRLALHEWGDRKAPPIVCLHGITGHARGFRRLAEERLAGRFRVVAPDLRGHGRSPYEPPWNLYTHCLDVIETVEAAGIERATWIGHSFGGRLTMEITAREPALVDRVVLLDPAIQLIAQVALDLAEDMRRERVFEAPEEAVQARIDSGRLFNTSRETVEEDVREHLERSPDGRLRYRYCQSAVVTAYSELSTEPPRYDRLRVPTLLVVGASSYLVLDEQTYGYREALGDLLEVVTVGGGHMVTWDAWAETGAALDAFLG